MDLATLHALNETRRGRQAAILVTDLDSGAVRLVRETDQLDDEPLAAHLAERFRTGRSGTVDVEGGGALFLTVSLPPPRLVVIGAVHISQALAPMARIAGFDVTIIDPRTAFATTERFPDVALLPQWPEEAFETIALDPFTALAALTHDPKIDDFALSAALSADCFYVGALGSRKTHAKRLDRLQALGLPGEVTARIRAPIGLAIGAQSPAEIAVSILAEIVGALRTRGTDTLLSR
ncbi:xanthine dehydrogenase accessory factor [Kaistia dalseonensis]|uniref:Xanthine dehydrogenase accessory factor n=1 Tax=Kaistia dalseonensis TaxID=410840 RepID=A0ABU0HBB5_9HYPH|nr:xanthine dehydrogenase accessory factor [Kaistia dalseonensis]